MKHYFNIRLHEAVIIIFVIVLFERLTFFGILRHLTLQTLRIKAYSCAPDLPLIEPTASSLKVPLIIRLLEEGAHCNADNKLVDRSDTKEIIIRSGCIGTNLTFPEDSTFNPNVEEEKRRNQQYVFITLSSPPSCS